MDNLWIIIHKITMNLYQVELYENLMKLCASTEAFYYQDFNLDNSTMRIFNYRLASYTDFLAPGAIECRGIMYEVDSASNEPIHLASLPMHKFFNYRENPLTMDLDLTKIKTIETKADGSLISTYIHNNELRLKSKGSLSSDQALAAMKWLDRPENLSFKNQLYDLTENWFLTVNLEWCSIENRIVIGYNEPQLFVLNARYRYTGKYLSFDTIKLSHVDVHSRHINTISVKDPVEFVTSIPLMQNIEGFVAKLEDGTWIKIKTNWYLSLHRAKDSINSPRRLFEAVLDDGIDDLRSLFFNDASLIKKIDEMQQRVDHLYNHLVATVESFYEKNKHLDRKEYAILGQKELNHMYFGLAMNLYLKKQPEYKLFLKKHHKDFGIKDDVSLEQNHDDGG
jgi:RNA ligase